DVFVEAGKPALHMTFPVAGAVSLEAGAGKDRLQVALVGREGMVGTSLLLDGLPANHAVAQFAGTAWRAEANALADCLAQHHDLHRQMLRGVNTFISQLSSTAIANGRGTIAQRVEGWVRAGG